MQGQKIAFHRTLTGARSSSSYSHCPANGFSMVYSETTSGDKGKEKNDDNAVINKSDEDDEEFERMVMRREGVESKMHANGR